MPKSKNTSTLKCDEHNRGIILKCGYYIKGRINLMNMKIKLHRKNCDICQVLKQTVTEEDFKMKKRKFNQYCDTMYLAQGNEIITNTKVVGKPM